MKDPAESRCCLEGTACIPAVKLRELPCNFNSKTCLVPLGPTLTDFGVANKCCKPRSRTVLHMCLRDSQGERDCRESERARERESERERGAERELFIPEENHRANVIQPKSGSAALSPLSSTNTSRAAVLPPPSSSVHSAHPATAKHHRKTRRGPLLAGRCTEMHCRCLQPTPTP